jgi:uncharacterized coiled-coil DUF342 family protein
MLNNNELTNSDPQPSEPMQSDESSLTSSSQFSPLEELWETDLTTLSIEQLREHLMRLREVSSSPTKRAQMLREESDAIKTKRAPAKKRVTISSDLY